MYNLKMLRVAFPVVMLTLLWYAHPTLAGFDWGSGEGTCSGSGTFQQQIPYYDIIDVGEIPAGKEGVDIRLTSEEDVDIQLYDKQSGEKIVHWPDGLLSGASKQSTQYHGVTVAWSGYNGDGINLGHEYIRLTGTTDRPLLMRAFGYRAGYATVDYSWTGTAGCTPGGGPAPSGSGTFEQPIAHGGIEEVGELIPGLKDVYIALVSDDDIDIQMYDKQSGEKIVHWPDGLLSSASKQTTQYHGITVEWSGYNGDGIHLGHEYIRLTGTTNRRLIMKVFGYQAGYATVNYHWGATGNDQPFPPTAITDKASTSPYATTENAFAVDDLNGQCTWYAYGRVMELVAQGALPEEVGERLHSAFWGQYGRHAKNWPSFLGGTWISTTQEPLPEDKRQKGLLAVWVAGEFGHVGFVEEVSADKTKYRLSDFNRQGTEQYRSAWYDFSGSSDKLLGTFPRFYNLRSPNW